MSKLDNEFMGQSDIMSEERTLNWYLDRTFIKIKAKELKKPSDRRLARCLDVEPSVVNAYRHERAFPSDETMMKIADWAGVDTYVALMDLNTWRAKGEAKKAYATILQKISAALVMAFGFTLIAEPAFAASGALLAPALLVKQSALVCILWKLLSIIQRRALVNYI